VAVRSGGVVEVQVVRACRDQDRIGPVAGRLDVGDQAPGLVEGIDFDVPQANRPKGNGAGDRMATIAGSAPGWKL